MMRPCVTCGELSQTTRCPDHTPTPYPKAPTAERGYGAAWQRLSRRARAIQGYCSDCGTTDDLTTDHSEQAWARAERGLPIRLVDVDVVCRTCNGRRGQARPIRDTPSVVLDPGGKGLDIGGGDPRVVASFPSGMAAEGGFR